MRQIIKNGTIVTGSGSFPADILIDGEKIAATGTAEEIKKLAQPGDKEIDASGCLIFPGFIDAHTHFDLHVAGTVTADDCYRYKGCFKRRYYYHYRFWNPVSGRNTGRRLKELA